MNACGRPMKRFGANWLGACGVVVACMGGARAADGAAKPATGLGGELRSNDTLLASRVRLTDADRQALQAALQAAQHEAAAMPDSAAARHRWALLAARQAHWLEAIDQFRHTLRLRPDDRAAANQLAWILAVCPSADFRDGDEALKLAQRLCEKSTEPEPTLLDTLAAALAEGGRFDEAVVVATRAIEHARAMRRVVEAEQIEARRELYRRERAYHP